MSRGQAWRQRSAAGGLASGRSRPEAAPTGASQALGERPPAATHAAPSQAGVRSASARFGGCARRRLRQCAGLRRTPAPSAPISSRVSAISAPASQRVSAALHASATPWLK